MTGGKIFVPSFPAISFDSEERVNRPETIVGVVFRGEVFSLKLKEAGIFLSVFWKNSFYLRVVSLDPRKVDRGYPWGVFSRGFVQRSAWTFPSLADMPARFVPRKARDRSETSGKSAYEFSSTIFLRFCWFPSMEGWRQRKVESNLSHSCSYIK